MKVLFIGNSHTYFNDMPALFASMCGQLCSDTPEVTMLAFSNRSLAWHTHEYFSVRFALLYGQYDYCVIQQYGHPFPGIAETEPYVKQLVALCRAAGTKPALLMTWAKKAEPESFKEIRDAYCMLAVKYDTLLAPVGELFDALNRTHPEIELYWKDGAHASPCGSYLVAAALAACILKPKDLSRLSDQTFDFRATFDEKQPCALEDRAQIPVTLPEMHAKAIRTAVEELFNEIK